MRVVCPRKHSFIVLKKVLQNGNSQRTGECSYRVRMWVAHINWTYWWSARRRIRRPSKMSTYLLIIKTKLRDGWPSQFSRNGFMKYSCHQRKTFWKKRNCRKNPFYFRYLPRSPRKRWFQKFRHPYIVLPRNVTPLLQTYGPEGHSVKKHYKIVLLYKVLTKQGSVNL